MRACSYYEVMTPAYLGVSHMHVINATHATYQFINTQNDTLIDEILITRLRST